MRLEAQGDFSPFVRRGGNVGAEPPKLKEWTVKNPFSTFLRAVKSCFMDPKFHGGPFDGKTLSELMARDDLKLSELLPDKNRYWVQFKAVQTKAYVTPGTGFGFLDLNYCD